MTTRTPSEPITSPGVQESPWANGLTISQRKHSVIP